MSSFKRYLFFVIVCLLNPRFHEAASRPLKNGALRLGSMKKGVFTPHHSDPSACTYVGENGRECHIHDKNFAGGVQQKSRDGMMEMESKAKGLAPPSGPSPCSYAPGNDEDCPIHGKVPPPSVHQESEDLMMESTKKGLVPPSRPSPCTKTGKNGGDCTIHENIAPESVYRESKGLMLTPPPSAGPSGCMHASNRGSECHIQGKNFAGSVGNVHSPGIASLIPRFHA